MEPGRGSADYLPGRTGTGVLPPTECRYAAAAPSRKRRNTETQPGEDRDPMKPIPTLFSLALLALPLTAPLPAAAQSSGPLRIEITEGVIEPLPYAVPSFVAESPAA